MNRETFKRDIRIIGGQREGPSLRESSLRSSYVNPLSDTNDLPDNSQPSSYMQRSTSPVASPCNYPLMYLGRILHSLHPSTPFRCASCMSHGCQTCSTLAPLLDLLVA